MPMNKLKRSSRVRPTLETESHAHAPDSAALRPHSALRGPTRTAFVAALLPLLCSFTACQYDIDGIYAYVGSDAGVSADTGVLPDTGFVLPDITAGPFINAWKNSPSVDADCTACAEEKCAEAELACRDDPGCIEYTKCVAQATDPAAQAACREASTAYVGLGNVRERDMAGPYGQCVFRDRCAAQCDGNTDLACLGKYAWPTTPAASVPMHLYLVDANIQTKVHPNTRVKVCDGADLQCARPLAQGVTNERGLVDLALPIGFSRAFTGFFEIVQQAGQNPDGTSIPPTVYPTLLKFSWPIAQETTQVINVVESSLVEASSSFLAAPTDPTRGMLQLRMVGCAGIGLRGVSFSADMQDANSTPWYLNQVPSAAATETDVVGSGGILNVKVGGTTVNAKRASDGMLLAQTSAVVRVGFMTVVIFSPNGQ
jgi:hypothetical protein